MVVLCQNTVPTEELLTSHAVESKGLGAVAAAAAAFADKWFCRDLVTFFH